MRCDCCLPAESDAGPLSIDLSARLIDERAQPVGEWSVRLFMAVVTGAMPKATIAERLGKKVLDGAHRREWIKHSQTPPLLLSHTPPTKTKLTRAA